MSKAALVRILRPRSLNQALGLLLGAVTLPVLLGALAVLIYQARQEHLMTDAQLGALAQTLVQAVDREFEVGKAQLEVIAASDKVDDANWSALRSFASAALTTTPGNIFAIVGPLGDQLVNTALPAGATSPDLWTLGSRNEVANFEGRSIPLSSQNVTKGVFATGTAGYSDLYYGFHVKRPTLAVAVPVVRRGEVAYAALLSFPASRLESLMTSAVTAPGIRASVIDRNGVIVASNAAASSRVGDTSRTVLRPTAQTGWYTAIARDGTEVRNALATSALNGFMVRVALPTAQAFSPQRPSAGWAVLAVSGLALLALTVGLYFVSALGARLAAPLRELGRAARKGERPADGPPTGISEIDALKQALQAGADAQEARNRELVVHAQREQAAAELVAADRQKDEFLATLAHELRNPLAPIRNAAEIIRRSHAVPPAVSRAGSVVERQVTYLSRLVDDLLDVSRITMGKIQLRPQRCDLREVASKAVEACMPTMDAAGHRFSAQLDDHPVMVMADEVRTVQCILNLLTNAVKFTPPGGQIDLTVAVQNGRAVVEVADSGRGLSPDSLERIFGLFAQEETSGTDGHSGLGIGLALTRKLVALQGGRVLAHSAGLGRGSQFRIELPSAAVSAAAVSQLQTAE